MEDTLAQRVREHRGASGISAGRAGRGPVRLSMRWARAKTSLAIAEKLAGRAGAEVDTADRRADLMQVEQAVDDAKRIAGMVKAEALATELAETISPVTQR